jgi:ZIP family zinc transporter
MAGDMDNDTRGWIMCTVSGIGKLCGVRLGDQKVTWTIACTLGASIICIDILVRLIPSKRNFRIQDSGVFLASSLSLSFGVMVSIFATTSHYVLMKAVILRAL